MKKIVVFCLIVVFIVCAYLGFKAASNLMSKNTTVAPAPILQVTTSPSSQINVLFIRVDDLTERHPRLISAWVSFTLLSDPIRLMLLPVFPAYDTTIQIGLQRSFALTKNGQIQKRFLSEIQKRFDVHVDGYILFDDEMRSHTLSLLSGQTVSSDSYPAINEEQAHAIRASDQNSWTQFCGTTTNATTATFLSSIHWNQLLPEHFVTNIDFETMALAEGLLSYPNGSIQCEVLVNEK